jgi:hypothetical protein
MIFGRNSNLKLGDVTFHIQTEDRGESHALIDTAVYYQGRVMHRRANNYFDLLPLDEDREQALKLRLDEQHRALIEEIRSGNLQLAVPPSVVPASPTLAPAPAQPKVCAPANERKTLLLELTNARSWLSGKRANLLVSVRQENGEAVSGALLTVHIEGSETAAPIHGHADTSGQARIEFDMPRITALEAALVISAEDHSRKGHLRFALRAKPRVV